MTNPPIVTVVVPTRNSSRFLTECLQSIKAQSYPNIEIVVVDNFSDDGTCVIASNLADAVYSAGPERSAQVNFGVQRATGQYVFRVDADFRLDPGVVAECMSLMELGANAVIVHNVPDESIGLLARIRKFEVDMYKFSLDHTAARFLSRDLFLDVGGLREDVTAGEDYDFQNRLQRSGVSIMFAHREAIHLDEPTGLMPLLRKYFMYGKDFPNYRKHNRQESRKQLAFLRLDYIRHWRSFVRRPLIGALFIGYHTCKFAAGAAGYSVALLRPGSAFGYAGRDNVTRP